MRSVPASERRHYLGMLSNGRQRADATSRAPESFGWQPGFRGRRLRDGGFAPLSVRGTPLVRLCGVSFVRRLLIGLRFAKCWRPA